MSIDDSRTDGRDAISQASVADTLRIISSVMLPTFGKGILIRRPMMEAAAERFGFDTGAVKAMQRLRKKYGSGPLRLTIPGRPQLLLLDPADVLTVLNFTPRPFAADTKEKRAALNHFEPGNVLVSDPARRTMLRPLHEHALDTPNTIHPLASRFGEIIEDEFRSIEGVDVREINWPMFAEAWFRVVRRVVLGDGARDDVELTKLLNRLRGRANWAFLIPQDHAGRRLFHEMLRKYVTDAGTGSLAVRMPHDEPYKSTAQIAQWLFAFDPAGMATFRTLALLACHPHIEERAREEALTGRSAGDVRYSFTRRCFLESLRLWPTTPAILRELTEDFRWRDGTVRKGTGVVIFTPFFNRDDESLTFANRMAPDAWERAEGDALPHFGIVPFSSGPAICPAHNLVPLLACATIAAVLRRKALSLVAPTLNPTELPGTLNHFGIRLGASSRVTA